MHGMDHFPESERPPLWLVFYAFRIMVAAGLGMLAMGLWGSFLWWRKKIDQPGFVSYCSGSGRGARVYRCGDRMDHG